LNTVKKTWKISPLERGAGVCLLLFDGKGWSGCCIFMLLISMLLTATTAIAATSLSYVYDANGNLINGDGKYYEYNDANQLVRVKYGDANGPVIAEYVYDYTGQRIKKIENGITTYYIGKHFEKQVDSAGAATKTSYYFANSERVAKRDSSGNVYYYHSDHLGGTNVLTDSAGNLVERIKYYPFGEIREGGNEKYSFTGKEKDKLSDLYYFEARYYNSEFKHFTQADTYKRNVYDPQELNKYAYVRNNPFKFIDPTGHEKVYVLNKSSGAIGAGHSALIVEKNGSYYYFSKGSEKGILGGAKITKGVYKKDDIYGIMQQINKDFSEKYDGIVPITTSKGSALAVYEYANDWKRKIDIYALLGMGKNCKDFVMDALKAGGIYPKKDTHYTYPNNNYSNLVENGYEVSDIPQEQNQKSNSSNATWFEETLQAADELEDFK
jgi:RHS repeat-associated protein